MQAAQYKALGLLLFIFTAMVALLLLATPGIQAQGTPLPTATSQGSPSTNPGGDNSNSNSDDDDDTAPLGAYIELNAKNHSTSAWSKVQWQDDGDQWHTVEGWCGTLDSK
ncbi:MAG: hypothetical protein GY934_23010, partial [Gammaproteobacteria bacterium]|nr:hypothetical protein [Gammaproteobacteria bacterium]